MSFTAYPAIDVRDGRVVRLRQGDYAQETRYDFDPEALARRYASEGAAWLHLVDLDAARAGGYTLRPLLGALRDSGLSVQTGGGVRSEADVEAILEAGAARVVIGSLAVRDPETVCRWIDRFSAERITVALDAREAQGRWTLPVHGWTEGSGQALEALVERYLDSGLIHVLSTDISRDGMLAGPNLGLYATLQKLAPRWQVQASGGVRGIDDVRAVKAQCLGGVVLGKALLEGRLDLPEALSC
ncbi:HisA/HisF-related TIM barrel protein [Pseudomarimonas salicorniae]|uniref:1-(5-phosphoribosyl)-5-[(5-phosphoribosylamino)methylideneamino] imidazole-4-carboxamide isomerase n=1 Tax=Pseudomarimonas salicorniae TaxID=2933270 RepID=A0ABT0GLI9_9GAMM|nr:1-(5-phosphoribosyl)-5-[(5-phosphoribosylamino)methylideneamino] imidazole-4-carboxamide isomerase [Lysobacter sp. CAU 1642]MCK7595404.1 1-(5-phosphoribosyl)-5-[(5-phosphoribosylamino)methylideneamino] imidazole-4-carboxamide isomerase [Lysobacter sp. CAU 1642]